MEKEKDNSSRRKFFHWGLGILSTATAFKLIFSKKKPAKPEIVKMLTEDGRLVEVDLKQITKTGKKVSDDDIHSWIKK